MCPCERIARWWRPAAARIQHSIFCASRRAPTDARGHQVLATADQRPRLVFHDGRQLHGLPVFDGSAYVPTQLLGHAE